MYFLRNSDTMLQSASDLLLSHKHIANANNDKISMKLLSKNLHKRTYFEVLIIQNLSLLHLCTVQGKQEKTNSKDCLQKIKIYRTVEERRYRCKVNKILRIIFLK